MVHIEAPGLTATSALIKLKETENQQILLHEKNIQILRNFAGKRKGPFLPLDTRIKTELKRKDPPSVKVSFVMIDPEDWCQTRLVC